MHKSSTGFVVVSLVAAVMVTGCAHKGSEPGPTAPTETSSMGTGTAAQPQTMDLDVTASRWAKVDDGPLSVTGMVGVGNFNGEAVCYASAGPACGNSSSPTADLGTQVYSCSGGACSPANGGRVESGRILCCGSIKGNGGKLRVAYTK